MSVDLHAVRLLPPARNGEAEVGERITVLDLTTSAVRDYRLVEPQGEQKVSVRSPLGSALLGRRVGDVISVESGGEVVRMEVVEIDG